MGKTALVLSGGGAKGAFQVGAERYLREIRGYHWDVISGVSVGALNGTLLAMRDFERLRHLWNTITTDDVYDGTKKGWKAIARLLLGAKSVYDTAPLGRLIDREIDVSKITDVDLRIGAVSLVTGEYHVFRPSHPQFKRALLASTSIPTVFPPIDVGPGQMAMVDGAIRNYSPLGAVLDAEPDEIVVINCMPRVPKRLAKAPSNALRVGLRTFEITTSVIFANDIEKFLRMNRMVEQVAELAAGNGSELQLKNRNGKTYRRITCTIIEPDTELGEALDFSREAINRHLLAGYEKAKEVFEKTKSP